MELSGEIFATTTSSSRDRSNSDRVSGTDQSETPSNPRRGLFRKHSKTSMKSSLSKAAHSEEDDNTRTAVADDGLRSRFGFSEDIEMSLG